MRVYVPDMPEFSLWMASSELRHAVMRDCDYLPLFFDAGEEAAPLSRLSDLRAELSPASLPASLLGPESGEAE